MQLSATPVPEPSSTLNINAKQQTVVIKTEPALRCTVKPEPKKSMISRLSLAKMVILVHLAVSIARRVRRKLFLDVVLQKLKQTLSKDTAPQNQRATEICAKRNADTVAKKDHVKKTIDQLKKKDILERNRASSMRARAKRKAWIQQLERNVTNVNEANAALQMEVKALRAEVAKLKTLLLAHKDCPVTKAMQKGKLV